jgi:hypothetical protein
LFSSSDNHKKEILEKRKDRVFYLDNYCVFRGEFLKQMKCHFAKNSLNTGLAVKWVESSLKMKTGYEATNSELFFDEPYFEGLLEEFQELFETKLEVYFVEQFEVRDEIHPKSHYINF